MLEDTSQRSQLPDPAGSEVHSLEHQFEPMIAQITQISSVTFNKKSAKSAQSPVP